MFKNISTTGKIGLIMQGIAGVGMGILVLIDKPVPDLLALIFFAGLAIAIVPDLMRTKK